MTRVLIPGATGFLGRYLTMALCAADYDVVAVMRAARPGRQNLEGKLQTIILPKPGLQEITSILKDNFDIVCHLAAFIPAIHLDPTNARLCIETNVMLTLHLLQASLETGVKRFVYFSTGNTYSQNFSEPAKETEALYPSKIAPFYLGSKMLAEIFVEHYRQQYSMNSVSLRLSSTYGIGMPAKSVVMNFIHKTLQGLPLQVQGGGHYKTDLVFVRDVIDVTMHALHSGPPGIYNVGSGVAKSILELAHAVAEVFERQVPIEIVSTHAAVPGGFRPLDIEKARTTWPWSPRSLQDGLRVMRAELERDGAQGAKP